MQMRLVPWLIVTFLLCGITEGQDQDAPTQIDQIEKLAEAATKMVLYSLVPHSSKQTSTAHNIKGFPILGEAEITDKNEQKTLLKALARGARESDRTVMLCFCPRHALHVESANRSVTFAICFQCLQVETQVPDEIGGFPISASPQAEFDAALKRHNLPRSSESDLTNCF
jgi:hypothetical protein